jgi:drug/metabolite transporter (DMT)-like permease
MTVLGAGIALVASFLNAVALVLQAGEARTIPQDESGHFRLLWDLAHRPAWVMGTALLVISWPLQVVALLFTPLTVAQPVFATFQLFLLLLAHFHLREHIGSMEVVGALAVSVGVVLVILSAPNRSVAHPSPGRLAIPLAVIGVAALVAFALGRRHSRGGLILALGAGLAYAWSDFVNKLGANAISSGHVLAAVIWLLTVVGFGFLAFLQENSALQRQSPVVVAPVVGALQDPLPVLMALAAGIEAWDVSVLRVAGIAAGLGLTALGAAVLAHSPPVAELATTR